MFMYYVCYVISIIICMFYTVYIPSSSIIAILRTSTARIISSIDALSILILNVSSSSKISSLKMVTAAHDVCPSNIMKNTTVV